VTMTNDTLCDPSEPIRYPETVLPPRTYSMAIVAKSKTDEEKIGMAMHRMLDQDPTLQLRRDSEVRQTIISGMGDTHLDVAVSRLKSGASVDVELAPPRVPYRETITRSAKGQGKYKRQSGGRGQYGDVWLRLEPKERGTGFEFVWEIVGGVVPTKYQPSIEKGLIEAMERGIVAGYRVVDVKAAAYDGTYHPVDSSDIAFKIAGSMGFRNVAAEAAPIILEPTMNVKVVIPDQYMGDIMGDLSAKRGKILGNEVVGKKIIVQAQVPLAEIFNYSKELRSMTQGRGVFEMTFSHYEPVPRNLQEKIIAESEARKTEEEQ
jgi:elongation factor G